MEVQILRHPLSARSSMVEQGPVEPKVPRSNRGEPTFRLSFMLRPPMLFRQTIHVSSDETPLRADLAESGHTREPAKLVYPGSNPGVGFLFIEFLLQFSTTH